MKIKSIPLFAVLAAAAVTLSAQSLYALQAMPTAKCASPDKLIGGHCIKTATFNSRIISHDSTTAPPFIHTFAFEVMDPLQFAGQPAKSTIALSEDTDATNLKTMYEAYALGNLAKMTVDYTLAPVEGGSQSPWGKVLVLLRGKSDKLYSYADSDQFKKLVNVEDTGARASAQLKCAESDTYCYKEQVYEAIAVAESEMKDKCKLFDTSAAVVEYPGTLTLYFKLEKSYPPPVSPSFDLAMPSCPWQTDGGVSGAAYKKLLAQAALLKNAVGNKKMRIHVWWKVYKNGAAEGWIDEVKNLTSRSPLTDEQLAALAPAVIESAQAAEGKTGRCTPARIEVICGATQKVVRGDGYYKFIDGIWKHPGGDPCDPNTKDVVEIPVSCPSSFGFTLTQMPSGDVVVFKAGSIYQYAHVANPKRTMLYYGSLPPVLSAFFLLDGATMEKWKMWVLTLNGAPCKEGLSAFNLAPDASQECTKIATCEIIQGGAPDRCNFLENAKNKISDSVFGNFFDAMDKTRVHSASLYGLDYSPSGGGGGGGGGVGVSQLMKYVGDLGQRGGNMDGLGGGGAWCGTAGAPPQDRTSSVHGKTGVDPTAGFNVAASRMPTSGGCLAGNPGDDEYRRKTREDWERNTDQYGDDEDDEEYWSQSEYDKWKANAQEKYANDIREARIDFKTAIANGATVTGAFGSGGTQSATGTANRTGYTVTYLGDGIYGFTPDDGTPEFQVATDMKGAPAGKMTFNYTDKNGQSQTFQADFTDKNITDEDRKKQEAAEQEKRDAAAKGAKDTPEPPKGPEESCGDMQESGNPGSGTGHAGTQAGGGFQRDSHGRIISKLLPGQDRRPTLTAASLSISVQSGSTQKQGWAINTGDEIKAAGCFPLEAMAKLMRGSWWTDPMKDNFGGDFNDRLKREINDKMKMDFRTQSLDTGAFKGRQPDTGRAETGDRP